MSRRLNRSNRPASRDLCSAVRNVCEPLESRLLLSDISWSNRGSEGFDALFGTNANLARTIVDRAIVDWETVIVSFNNLPGQGTFNLVVDCVDISSIASAAITSTSSGKPRAATIQVDSIGTTHYLDPTPWDDAEFDDNISNAFTGFAVTPGISGVDFYATMIHELGHALGMSFNRADLAIQGFLVNTGVDDPNTTNTGNLVSFNVNGGPIEATFTAADTGHLWEGPATTATNNAGLPIHPDDLMNPGRAINSNERNLISDLDAAVLRDAYGYTVAMPSTINNILVNPNFSNDVLTVNGLPGNVNDTIVVQGDFDPNRLHVTVGSFTETVPLNEVTSIIVNGGNGSDLFRLEYAAGRFTTYNGGAGVDTLDLAFATRNLSNISGPTLFNGGPDADFMHLYDNNYTAGDLWSIDDTRLTRFGTGLQQYDGQVENVFLTTGTAHNPLSIPRTRAGCKIYLNSAGGQDLVNIGLAGQGTANILGEIEIQNDPSFTTIAIDDTGRSVARFPLIELFGQFGWVSRLAGANFTTGPTIFWDNADVQDIWITTGGGDDGVDVRQCSERLYIDNSGGRDSVSIGNGSNGLQQITAQIDIEPTPVGVLTDLVLNGAVEATGRTVNVSLSGSDVLVSNLAPVQIRCNHPALASLTLLGGTGNDTFNVLSATYSPAMTIDAGAGVDIVNAVGAEMTSLTVRGGTDSVLDFLSVQDQTFPGNVEGGDVYPTRIRREISGQTSEVFYSGFSSVEWCQQNSQNVIAVYGTSADIAPNYLFSIVGGSLDDIVYVYTRDAQGNQTINGNLYFSGGGGPDWLSIVSGAAPENYRFTNFFGGSTTYMGGAGTGWIAAVPGVENVIVNGSSANDTFAVEQFTSGSAFRINGGNGDDACTLGTGDISATLTSAAAFTFDGGGNTDRFTIANGVTSVAWSYQVSDGFITSSKSGYSWHSVLTGVERQYVFAGSGGDAMYVDSTPTGMYTEFNGFGGIDGLGLGFATNNLETIRGPIVYNPGTDGGNLAAYDMADTSGDTVHLTATTLGAYAGDTLFGPGGSLTFSNLVDFGAFPGITLGLGSGADTVYAQPLATARVTIDGNGPTTTPGDSLRLATAALVSPSVNGTPASGNLTSANRQQLTWTEFEGSIVTDAVAPAVLVGNINLNGIPAGGRGVPRRQSVDVRFSENVAGLLSPASLLLTNLSTNQTIPTNNIAVEYDTATNTAHFTFPGYEYGVLPDGDYQGRVLAGLTDSFGNALPSDVNFNFFFMQGDADHNGVVDFDDYVLIDQGYNNGWAGFANGDFNYDGVIDFDDYVIIDLAFNTQ